MKTEAHQGSQSRTPYELGLTHKQDLLHLPQEHLKPLAEFLPFAVKLLFIDPAQLAASLPLGLLRGILIRLGWGCLELPSSIKESFLVPRESFCPCQDTNIAGCVYSVVPFYIVFAPQVGPAQVILGCPTFTADFPLFSQCYHSQAHFGLFHPLL